MDAKTSPFGQALTEYQCLQYALDKPGVLTVLPGIRGKADLDRILGFLEAGPEETDYSVIGNFAPQDANGKWRCCTRVEHGPSACDAPTIQESELQAAVIKAINIALGNRGSMTAALQENVETVIRQEDESSAEGIEVKLEELQKELLKRANFKKDYNDIADEIHRLRELKQNALAESVERKGLKKRIVEMQEFLNGQATEVLEYDEQLVRRLIEKITVYDERFEVEFKSGMTVDVER